MQRYLGVISGTSMDAIDVVTLIINEAQLTTAGFYSHPYPKDFKDTLEQLCHPEQHAITGELDLAAAADVRMATLIAEAVHEALRLQALSTQDIIAIGSHGQNIRHRPTAQHAFSMQIGNPSVIADRTGIDTVANFRMADVAAGGQGAPLAPAFHLAAFACETESRGILNLGGIANITKLPQDAAEDVIGFDTGPANTLMDQWILKHRQMPFDKDGAWAMSGQLNQTLLDRLLKEPYFAQQAPKSTGRELFNLQWLEKHLTMMPDMPNSDVQRTLLECSAQSIANCLNALELDRVFTCGGGVNNGALLARIAANMHAPESLAGTTEQLGIHPQQVEGAAFAWFAHRTLARLPANLPAVTGAKRSKILGGIYYA